jgi:hypothetical protein
MVQVRQIHLRHSREGGNPWHVSAYFLCRMKGIKVEGARAPLDSRLRGNDGGIC